MGTYGIAAPWGESVKVTVTNLLEFIITMQVFVPLHPSPDQPMNLFRGSGAAIKITIVLFAKLKLQKVPQSIPEGVLKTVPWPSQDLFILREFRVTSPSSQFIL